MTEERRRLFVQLESAAKGFVRKRFFFNSTCFRHACGFQMESRKASRLECRPHSNGRETNSNEW